MTEMILPRQRLYTGTLILVNSIYAYQEGSEKEECGSLVPVLDQAVAGGLYGQNTMRPQQGQLRQCTVQPQQMQLRQSKDQPQQMQCSQGADSQVRLSRCAAEALSALLCEIDGWRHIVPVSGWRSMGEQQQIWDDSLAENGRKFTETYVAVPGHSEHQTGLAIDLGIRQETIDFIRPEFPYEGICGTFRKKAPDHGFVERYPKGKEGVTGIGHEPWHFRYVGTPHAAVMTAHGFTLEEYIAYLRRFPYGKNPYLISDEKGEIRISFLEASACGDARLKLDAQMQCQVSGNNADGFIVTEWRRAYA